MELFQTAVKNKYRYPTSKGNVNTEDLFDLSLKDLDATAKSVNKQIKETEEESFISVKTTENSDAHNKLEIIKSVIAYKIAVAEANEKRMATKERNRRINEIIAAKEDADLMAMPLEELKKLVQE